MIRFYVFLIFFLIIITPIIDSHLRINYWRKPTQRPTSSPVANPTFRPTTASPSGPSNIPTPIPTTPTNKPTWKPTTPTMQPITREPTVYDFKTMNRDGYIAVCVLVPYAFIGYTCILTFFMIGNGCCDTREIEETRVIVETEINIDVIEDNKSGTKIETEIDFDVNEDNKSGTEIETEKKKILM